MGPGRGEVGRRPRRSGGDRRLQVASLSGRGKEGEKGGGDCKELGSRAALRGSERMGWDPAAAS